MRIETKGLHSRSCAFFVCFMFFFLSLIINFVRHYIKYCNEMHKCVNVACCFCVCVSIHACVCEITYKKWAPYSVNEYIFFIYTYKQGITKRVKKNTKKTTMNFVFKCCKHSNAYAHFDFICFVLIQLDSWKGSHNVFAHRSAIAWTTTTTTPTTSAEQNDIIKLHTFSLSEIRSGS